MVADDEPALGLSGTGGEDWLPIPDDGLREVLSGWSGRGQLLAALAAVRDDGVERQWGPGDVRRRAHRVLLARLEPILQHWPKRATTWLDALPAQSVRTWGVASAPAAGTDWIDTRRRFGWPPRQFAVRSRSRIPDTLLVTTLRWTLEALALARADAVRVLPTADEAIGQQLDVAIRLLDEEPVGSSASARPSVGDLASIRREGKPWAGVAEVARLLLDVDASLDEWARRLIVPSPELRWRLFHLAVLGAVLRALRKRGGHCISKRPLSAAGAAPAYAVAFPDGSEWDLWFEAGAAWKYYGISSPYVQVTESLQGSGQPLEMDLLLVKQGVAALVIECKYSASMGTVGRTGVPQTLAYLSEVRSRLAASARACVIAPDGVIAGMTAVPVHDGVIGVGAAADVDLLIGQFLGDFMDPCEPAPDRWPTLT